MTFEHENEPTLQPAGAARTALLLATVWLLAGALFKLLAGSPNDLPQTIQDFPALKPEWTFRLAIGTELAISALVLLRPRIGWLLIVGLFAFFDFVLYKMGAAGETKCGCFGGNAPEWLTPFVMMVFDSVLLFGVLITRPWRSFGDTRPTLLPSPLMVLLLIMGLLLLPWHPGFFQVATPPPPSRTTTEATGVLVQAIGEATGLARAGEADTTAGEPEAAERGTGDWYGFTPSKWRNKAIADTDLAAWIEGGADMAYSIPAPAHVVVYRVDCDHCREHFIHLQENPPDQPIALIKVPDVSGGYDVTSDVKPLQAAVDLTLRELPKGYGITTPVTFQLDETWTIGEVVEHKE